jgi:hypothetical protein
MLHHLRRAMVRPAEIERGNGRLFDMNAADACLRLFREKCYQLPA